MYIVESEDWIHGASNAREVDEEGARNLPPPRASWVYIEPYRRIGPRWHYRISATSRIQYIEVYR